MMNVEDELTVSGELNKLAWNMALGRNEEGVHYRSNGIEGLRLGEQAAIDFLRGQLSMIQKINENKGEIELTLQKFSGEDVTLRPLE